MEKRNLPIGIQDFEEIRKNNYIYVDKTDLIYKLATEGKPYFLARPRRFGKSLLVSTMKAYFEGRKDLFEGLAISKLEKKWEVHPVIHIDFSGAGKFATNEELTDYLNFTLKNYEQEYGITDVPNSLSLRFSKIIKTSHDQSGKQVAVLIDEYDKPLLDALQTPDRDKNHYTMASFYGVLKSCDPYMCFLFLTGITKFAKVSIFSELNQLKDISMTADFTTICGISEEELQTNFTDYIKEFAETEDVTEEELLQKLKQKYDGYHFSKRWKDMYNPFSLLNAFANKEFNSYWFQTATPKMLFGLIEDAHYDLTDILDGVQVKSSSFSDYRVGGGSLTPIIYHSGYLTIKDYDERAKLYTLGFPNKEIQDGFTDFLLPLYTNFSEEKIALAMYKFKDALARNDISTFMKIFDASVSPEFWSPTSSKEKRDEKLNNMYAYQVAFHAMLRMTGFDVVSEQQVIGGRVDVTLETSDTAYIFELKMDDGKPWEEVARTALAQIEKKGYATRFDASQKKIYKMGLVFSTEKGGVAGYLVE